MSTINRRIALLVSTMCVSIFARAGETRAPGLIDTTDHSLTGKIHSGALEAGAKGAAWVVEQMQSVAVEKHIESQLSGMPFIKDYLSKNPEKGALVKVPAYFNPYIPEGPVSYGNPILFGEGADVGEAWDYGDATPGIQSTDFPITTFDAWATKWVWVTTKSGKLKFSWEAPTAVALAGGKHKAIAQAAAKTQPSKTIANTPVPQPIAPSPPPAPAAPQPSQAPSHDHAMDSAPFDHSFREPPPREPPTREPPTREPPQHDHDVQVMDGKLL